RLFLKYFDSGALIIKDRNIKKFTDPFHHPLASFKMLFNNIATWGDKINLIKRRIETKSLTENQIFEKFEVKTSSILKKKRFTGRIIKNFFQPLFSSIFMENELTTSRRIFDYTFKMMMEGRVALPAYGIEAIPRELATNFKKENFIFNTSVLDFSKNEVSLNNGETIKADIFIAATDYNSLFRKMKNEPVKMDHRSTTCMYFSSDKKPFTEPMVCINGNDIKLVSNIVVLTNLYKNYAPKGKELISVSLNGLAKADDKVLEEEVKDELKKAFGKEVLNWKLIKIYRIDYALPNQDFVLGKRQVNELRLGKNAYACGDHLLYGSMNAAMKTGKMVAEIIHKDFNPGHKIEKKKKYDSIFDNEIGGKELFFDKM
ncbi:MAG: FAD-dependent oxidoreductase, partial [Bacteroidia bacterium]